MRGPSTCYTIWTPEFCPGGGLAIYFDHSATTPVRPEAAQLVHQAMTAEFGNPSSLHQRGLAAERLLKTARRQIAAALKVNPAEIFFTSGGTEANNLALRGGAQALRRAGQHIITTAVEHSSVLDTGKYLAQQGYDLTVLPVDEHGRVSPDALAAALRPDTILVSIMLVNNELGTIQPVERLGRLIVQQREDRRFPLFHVDAVQALGRLPVEPRQLQADLLTISGHKIGGPKGAGALYIRRGVQIVPQMTGGQQEQQMRPGTENVPGLAALGLAVELAEQERPRLYERHTALRHQLLGALAELPLKARLNSPSSLADTVPGIINVGFSGLRAETLVHALAEQNIYVSTGSACHSRQVKISHVLTACQVEQEIAQGSIRISLGRSTDEAQIDGLAQALAQLVPPLQALAKTTR